MIVVLCTFDVDPADRDAFVESRRAQAAESCAEHGCLDYAFSLDVLEPGRVRLTERWESQEDFGAHLQRMQSSPPAADIAVLGRSFYVFDAIQRGA